MENLDKEELRQAVSYLADQCNELRVLLAHEHQCGASHINFKEKKWICMGCGSDFLNDEVDHLIYKIKRISSQSRVAVLVQ